MNRMLELRINRRNTSSFIAANPMTLTLIPVARVRTSSGGTTIQDLPPRAEQTFRLLDQSSISGSNPGLVKAQDGQQLQVIALLLGEYDCDMEAGDHWSVGKARFEIAEVLPDNGYERRGRVIRYGG